MAKRRGRVTVTVPARARDPSIVSCVDHETNILLAAYESATLEVEAGFEERTDPERAVESTLYP